MAESLANLATTSLSAPCAPSDATISVANTTPFPAAGQYRIRIDSELILVTGGNNTLTWNVTRGVEGTASAAHSSGASVTHILTAQGLANFITSTAKTIPTTVVASYISTPGLTTVFYTALRTDGTTLTARTQTGVAELYTNAGLYTYTQNVVGIPSFIARWDDGDAAAYSEELITTT